MNEALIFNLERLWFDFNYGGLAVTTDEMMNWSYAKIRRVYDWFVGQKKLEEKEFGKIPTNKNS